MADLGLTNSPLIRDLYNTPEEALMAATTLGISGFRVYNINGQTKYVPGATFIEYEKAIQLVKVQGKIVRRGDETFGGKLVGLQFANSKTEIQGDPFLTFGNFSITTAQSRKEAAQVVDNDSPKSFTAQQITDRISDNAPTDSAILLDDVVNRIDENMRVKVNFDRRKLENYVMFSSLKERIRQAVQEVILQFPAALHITPVSITHPTVSKCMQIVGDNQTTITLNQGTILNPLSIDFNRAGLDKETTEEISKFRNFAKTYPHYVLHYKGVEYPILNAELPAKPTDAFTVTVQGLPFKDVVTGTGTVNANFYLKPAQKQYELFYDGLSDLASFLLNVDGDLDYVANVFVPREDDNGVVINEVVAVRFPKYDDFNIDVTSDKFDEYLNQLNNIAEDFDRYKTNIIARFLTTESLQEFDTEDRKFNIVMQLYGRMFDQVKQYVDGLTYVRNVSYDKIENIPDALLKNFARMLGLKTFEIQDDDTLIQSLFDFNETEVAGDITPVELDIEIWRRVLANVSYLLKSKGTRKSIEFILELIGVPEPIIEINEYVYVADSKIDTVAIDRLLYGTNEITGVGSYPYDADGYPTTPNMHFQANGGNLRLNDENQGLYDFGKRYIDQYKKFADGVFGFDLYRTVDNQKSWAQSYNEQYRENYQDLRHTFYYEKDSRLVVNSKEIEAYISLDRIFDIYPFRYAQRNGLSFNGVSASNLTFDQYLVKVLNDAINVRNRKTIQTYPTLSKIYFDYRKALGNSESYIDFRKSMEFINKFDSYWVKFIEQFLPATSIVNAGKKIDNSIHFQNKFKFRHGKNVEVEWKGTDGSEYQNKALKPVNWGETPAADTKGKQAPRYHSNMDVFDVTGIANRKYLGHDKSHNDYYGIQYSIEDYCEYKPEVFVWDAAENYATKQQGRVGVFVIYDNRLWRYRSTATGSTVNVKPNKSADYEFVDDYVDAKTITFADCPNPTQLERDFFVDVIGFALAYKRLDADFDCPPPKPHVCYHNFGGRIIRLNASGATLPTETTDPTAPTSPQFTARRATDDNAGTHGTYIFHPNYQINGDAQVAFHLTTTGMWKNASGNLTDGRVNYIGVWSQDGTHPVNEWLGFAYKITLAERKTLYVGMAADDYFDLKIDGKTILHNERYGLASPSLPGSFNAFLIYPVTLEAGDHYFEYRVSNQSGGTIETNPGILAFEIYDATAAQIAACTTNAQLDALVIAGTSTLTAVGQPILLGGEHGYSCPAGWFVDNSGGTPVCTRFVTTGITGNTSTTWLDDLGSRRTINQPQFYGYSLNTGSTRPPDAVYGTSGKWAVPYVPVRTWADNTMFYKDEIVMFQGNPYKMTQDFYTGTGLTTTITGATSTSTVPGLYQKYQQRTKTDPFMHMQTAYLDVFTADPTKEKLSINLTKDLNLYHIFSGATQETSFRVMDNIIDEQIYISDSITVNFDGFYPVNGEKLGPVYTVEPTESYVNTVSDSLSLRPGVMNYIDLRSLGTGFTNNSVNFVLTEELPGYYLVNNTSFLTFKFDLFFSSNFRGDQDVIVYLVNQNGKVMNEERFTFSGGDAVEDRVMQFVSQSVFLANQRLFLAIKPVSHDCRLVRFEEVSFSFNDKAYNDTNYFEMHDVRFRLNFNGGRAINDGYFYDPVISMSPVSNVFNVASKFYPAADDLIGRGSVYQPRRRNYNEIEFRQDISPQYPINYLFDQYYKKYQIAQKQSVPEYKERYALDREIGYNKVDFTYAFQTRVIPTNSDFNATLINGDTKHINLKATSQFLGNTLVDHENAQPTKNIVIGSNPTLRQVAYDSTLNINSTTQGLFGYGSGLSDYTPLNHRTKENYYDLNYLKVASNVSNGLIKDVDRPVPSQSVRSSQIYKDVLAQVVYFDKRIINYKLNDVVKVYDDILKEDILFVCVRDVEMYHYNASGILPEFQYSGAKSLFVEISKYNPRNFEVTGYKDSATQAYSKVNIKDFVDNDIKLEVSGNTAYSIDSITPGQIIKYTDGINTRYHKFVYTKDVVWKQLVKYRKGDFVLAGGGFYVVKTDVNGSEAHPSGNTTNYAPIDPIRSNTWATDSFSSGVAEVYWNAVAMPAAISEVQTDRLYFYRAKKYNSQPFTAYAHSSNASVAPTTFPYTNEYDQSAIAGAYPKPNSQWIEYHQVDTTNSFMPLFEVAQEIPDAPAVYDPTQIYNKQSNDVMADAYKRKMGDTKVVFNNKVYSYKAAIPFTGSTTNNPASASDYWEAKDFMLVESMKFYKERTKIKVYDGKVSPLSADMLSSFEMFTDKLALKPGYSKTQFRGYTDNDGDINHRLERGLDLINRVKDPNRSLPKLYGKIDVRREQSDLILDYYYEFDKVGNLPITGEFAGLLHVSNPCGHSASVVVGAIFTNSQNSLDLIKPRDLDIINVTAPVDVTPYTIRLLFNQTGRATGKISWTGAATGSAVLEENSQYDQVLTVAPDKELTFTLEYNVANKQTRFEYAYLDDTNLFPVRNRFGRRLLNRDLFAVDALYDDNLRTETRTITIKATKQNHVLRIGLQGVEEPNFERDLPFNNIINIERKRIDGTAFDQSENVN